MVFITLGTHNPAFSTEDVALSGIKTEEFCEPIVTAFDQTICLHDVLSENELKLLMPHSHDENTPPPQSEHHDLEKRVIRKAQERVVDQMVTIALQERYGSEALIPDDALISRYSNAHNALLEKGYQTNARTYELITDLLATKKYAPETRQELERIQKSLETGIKYYNQKNETISKIPAEFKAMVDESRSEMFRDIIEKWQRHKLLFEEFGGSLSLTTSEAIPVDGYLNLLDYIENKGQPNFSDESFKGVLDQKRESLKSLSILDPENKSEIYKEYYSAPEWYLISKMTDHNFNAMAEKLRALE